MKNTSKLRVIFVIIGIFYSSIVCSANMSIVEYVRDKYILIEGNIENDDYQKFIKIISTAGPSVKGVFIASKGGDAIVAMKIGKLIRSLHLATEVPYYYTSEGNGAYCKPSFQISKSNCLCLSSCVLIYLSGIERNGDYLGIHRAFINHKYLKELSINEAVKYSNQISQTMGNYLAEMGAPESLLEKIKSISSEDIELLSYNYINKYLRGYSLNYQEWIIAKCGGNESKLLEEQRKAQSDKNKFWEITRKIARIERCKQDLIQKERKKVFSQIINKEQSK